MANYLIMKIVQCLISNKLITGQVFQNKHNYPLILIHLLSIC